MDCCTSLMGGHASDWFAAFKKVDLGQLRAFAKRNRQAVKPRAALARIAAQPRCVDPTAWCFGKVMSRVILANPISFPSLVAGQEWRLT